MNTDHEHYPDDEEPLELVEEYEAELHRRLEEIDSGRAKMLTLEEVMVRLHRRPTSDD